MIVRMRFFLVSLFALAASAAAADLPAMHFGDTTRVGRPFAKDPSVIRFQDRYLLYYSIPAYGDGRPRDGWSVGIAESRDLVNWSRVGELRAEADYEAKGVAAPFAMVHKGRVHLFYQTYGNGPRDAICHAESADGLRFTRDATNPIFRPTGAWNSGRAIDVEITRFQGKWFLYAATRDAQMKLQMLTGAVSSKGFARGDWTMISPEASILRPELPWEQECIEAPTVVRRGKTLVMFYAGAYNNAPQQIGVATSTDGIHWKRASQEPFLRVGPPGSWNSSESGHPGAFVDRDGRTYLFYQGNNDNGRTWYLSQVEVEWSADNQPHLRPARSNTAKTGK